MWYFKQETILSSLHFIIFVVLSCADRFFNTLLAMA